jgi:hypothetical protein
MSYWGNVLHPVGKKSIKNKCEEVDFIGATKSNVSDENRNKNTLKM